MRIRRRDKTPTPAPTETPQNPVTPPGPTSMDPVKSLISDVDETANGAPAPAAPPTPSPGPSRLPCPCPSRSEPQRRRGRLP